jgi:hypothetical protein
MFIYLIGHYAFIESSRPRVKGDKAWLQSPKNFLWKTYEIHPDVKYNTQVYNSIIQRLVSHNSI